MAKRHQQRPAKEVHGHTNPKKSTIAGTIAGEDHYYVPKSEADYVLWNRLNQVDNPARLDESETQAQ